MGGHQAFASPWIGCPGRATTLQRACTRRPKQTRMCVAPGPSGVNVNKYASQRSILSAEKDMTPEEINALLERAGKPPRDVQKWRRAIEHSYVIVSARLLSSNTLVGFARATSDRALNGTIWDLVTDPALPDRPVMARNVIQFLLKEIRRTVPTCSIALLADPEEVAFFEGLDFVDSPDGIKAMTLVHDVDIDEPKLDKPVDSNPSS